MPSSPRTPRRRFWLAATVVIALLLAACGDDGPSTTDDGSGAAPSAAGAFPVDVVHALGTTTVEAEPTRVVTVGTGDTLWAIAADLADDGDVQAMMTRIERLNALESGMLSAGQRLVVPAE